MQRAKRYIIIIGISVLVILVAGLVLASIFNILTDVLFIFLIILATLSIVSTAALIYLLATLIRTITVVRDEVKPLLGAVQETVNTVKGSMEETLDEVKATAKSASNTVSTIRSTADLASFGVAPAVRAASVLVASGQMARVFMGKGRSRHRYEERRKEQMEFMKAAAEGE
jgi:phage-related protein